MNASLGQLSIAMYVGNFNCPRYKSFANKNHRTLSDNQPQALALSRSRPHQHKRMNFGNNWKFFNITTYERTSIQNWQVSQSFVGRMGYLSGHKFPHCIDYECMYICMSVCSIASRILNFKFASNKKHNEMILIFWYCLMCNLIMCRFIGKTTEILMGTGWGQA